MQMHELGISPLERGPAFQAAGADVCIDIWVVVDLHLISA